MPVNLTDNSDTWPDGEGNIGDDEVYGLAGNDRISGGEGNDALYGGTGEDSLDGGTGTNTLAGGAGDDWYYIDGSGTTTIIEEGDNTSTTGNWGDWVVSQISYTLGENLEALHLGDSAGAIDGAGNELDNNIEANDSNNVLNGFGGNDRLDGRGGNDTMDGGAGNDLYTVDSSNDVVIDTGSNDGQGEDGSDGDRVESTVDYTLDFSIEDLELKDFGQWNGSGEWEIIQETDIAGTGNDRDNTIRGSEGDNLLSGLGGDDRLDGKGGNDTLIGGEGDDVYIVDSADDVVDEQENDDQGIDGSEGDRVQSTANWTMSDNIEKLELRDIGEWNQQDNEWQVIQKTNINGTGNDQDNDIEGSTGNNVLTGLGGNDRLDGGAGADTMVGGEGNDSYYVDDINDVIDEQGSNLGQDITGSGGDKVESTVTWTLSGDIEQLELRDIGEWNEQENEWQVIQETNISGTGNDLDNDISGSSGNNILTGLAGNDRLNGGDGADTLIGGAGNDQYFVNSLTDVIIEEGSNDGQGGHDWNNNDRVESTVTWTLSENIEYLSLRDIFTYDNDGNVNTTQITNINGTGNGRDNHIWGSSGKNVLYGLGGNDYLDGGAGADSMYGGEGNDEYVVDNAADVVSDTGSNLNQGEEGDRVQSTVTLTLSNSIENLSLRDIIERNNQGQILSTHATNINGTGNAFGNRMDGSSGNNILKGLSGNDDIVGGEGNDALYGDLGNDYLGGEEGNDILYGGDGNDFLEGNDGNDTLNGGKGNDVFLVDPKDHLDTIVENSGEGTDLVVSTFDYSLGANLEDLFLIRNDPEEPTEIIGEGLTGTGNVLANHIYGNNLNNSLNGMTGADFMYGGEGDDTYSVDNSNDVASEAITVADFKGLGFDLVLEEGGVDSVISSATYTLSANIEELTLTGTTAINGTGNDLDNTLLGNSGANILDGKAGADAMEGGLGNDTYLVDNDADTIIEKPSEGMDTVQSSISYTLTDTNLENLTLIGSANINGAGNALANILTGNAGANILDGGMGADKLLGGDGNDTYIVDTSDIVTETNTALAQRDTVKAGFNYTLGSNVENLILTGDSDINGTGNTLNNELTGNSGDNLLSGGIGADTMNGADGNDTYLADNVGDSVVEANDEGTDHVQASVSFTLGANVENLTLTGTGAINGSGNDLDNTLLGNSGANVLDGGEGADAMAGGLGNDTYAVDNAADVITEALAGGTDTVRSSISYDLTGKNLENLTLTGSATIDGTGNALNNILTGNAGDNILDGGAGADKLIGGDGNDTYLIDSTTDVVTETNTALAQRDTVKAGFNYTLGSNVENLILTGSGINATGNTLNNELTGNSGNNLLSGGTGADTMTGAGGNDTYLVDNVGDSVVEANDEGTDHVQSSVSFSLGANVENLTLTGTSAINGTGNDLGNTLLGNSGANKLDGGTGADAMTGGSGNDTYVVDDTGDSITEIASGGTDTVESSISYDLTGKNLENLTLTGADAIDGTGNSLSNILKGNDGTNELTGGLGNDTYIVGAGDTVSEVGTSLTEIDTVQSSVSFTLGANIENLTLLGADAIDGTGNDLKNTLTGNAGDNILDGGAGADKLLGGDGNDTYVVDAADVVTETNTALAQRDTVKAGFNYTLGSNVENLILTGSGINATGNTLNNELTGNSGNNLLSGGTGADTMTGAGGNDTYLVDNVGDSVVEANDQGTDLVQSSVSFTLGANVENLTLIGTTAINGTGNDLDNTLLGNSGANKLDGGTGADAMTGGAGNDTYVVDNKGDSITEALSGGTDTVESSISYDLTGKNLENLTLTGSAAIDGIGNALSNILKGNDGTNELTGGLGNDTYIVGAGDTVSEVGTSLTEIDTVQSSVSFTLGANLENLTLLGSETIDGTGNGLKNILTGNAGANILDGGAGADKLIGGDGNDTYVVDAADVVTETNTALAQRDTVKAGFNYTLGSNVENLILTGDDNINGTGNTLNNELTGNDGYNLLNGGTGADTINGGFGNDTLTGGVGNDVFAFDTTLNVDRNKDTITDFTVGKDKIQLDKLIFRSLTSLGALSPDSFRSSSDGAAGDGNDFFLYNTTTGALSYDADGSGTVSSAIQFATLTTKPALTAADFIAIDTSRGVLLTGDSENNSLTGSEYNDTLDGLAGNDTLDGGLGNDTLIGGSGNDTFIVDAAGDQVSENLDEGWDTVRSSITYTLGANLEQLQLEGDANLNGTGNGDQNLIHGNNGDNILTGDGGNDELAGLNGNDTLYGDAGSDSFLGGEGVDDLYGGLGSDTLYGDRGSDNLYGQEDSDTLYGDDGSDLLNGDDGNDRLFGGADNDVMQGGNGDDILDGGEGSDSMQGGIGNDQFIVDSAGDEIIENADQGWDKVTSIFSSTLGGNLEMLELGGSEGIDATGNNGDNRLLGNSGNNILTDDAGNDTLEGAAGDDSLNGGIDNDFLAGGEGNDTLNGGAGSDEFIFNTALDGDSNVDTISDFTLGEDKINLDVAYFGQLTTGLPLPADSFYASEDGTAADDNDFILYNTTTGELYYDADGYGNDLALLFATLTTAPVLTEADFSLTGTNIGITLAGGSGYDYLVGSAGNDTLSGGDDDDFLVGGAGNDSLDGDNGGDLLRGGIGDDILDGGEGIDYLEGGAGIDIMRGGRRSDTYYVDEIGDQVIENVDVDSSDYSDWIYSSVSYTLADNVEYLELLGNADITGTGTSDYDVLIGNNGNNYLSGGGLDDLLVGSSGNDTLDGGTGNDTMRGYDGDHQYLVDSVGDVVSELYGDGWDTVFSSVSFNLAGTDGVEQLQLQGSANIDGTGSAEQNVLNGNAGNNILSGNEGNDMLYGGTGGADTMYGGSDNDIYRVDSFEDQAIENADDGRDMVLSSTSYTISDNIEVLFLSDSTINDTLASEFLTGTAIGYDLFSTELMNWLVSSTVNIDGTGNSGDNMLFGNGGNNVLSGGAGNDELAGLTGNDTMIGGIGDDWYMVDSADDLITEFESEGFDAVKALTSYTLGENLEQLTLDGNANINGSGNSTDNELRGNTGDNILSGSAGNDMLRGGAGNDTLAGGEGNDILNDGEGDNQFVFDTALDATNIDEITNFTAGGGDKIALDTAIFGGLTEGSLSSGQFLASANGTAADGDDYILYNTTSGGLFYDADGSGTGSAAVQFATITTMPTLTENDFIVIS